MNFQNYCDVINKSINNHIDEYYSDDKCFAQCIKFAVKNGKRFRSMITLDIINTLQDNIIQLKDDNITNSLVDCSLAIEYAHNASLIMDDLPCMDNAMTRRDDLSFHRKYNEAISMLATVGLTFMSTQIISKSIKNLSNLNYFEENESHRIGFFLLTELAEWMGLNGLSRGQLYDLSLINPDINIKLNSDYSNVDIEDIFDKKTGSLFEFSFIIGWVVGKGKFEHISEIRKLAYDFGKLYQILDDFEDYSDDILKENKSFNYIIRVGLDKALIRVNSLIEEIKLSLQKHGIYSQFFINLLIKFESLIGTYKKDIV